VPKDPLGWFRHQTQKGYSYQYDNVTCKVCGGLYRRGDYSPHKAKPAHKRALR
jgi:hypothetical protein